MSIAEARHVHGGTTPRQDAHRTAAGLLPHLQRAAGAPHPGQLRAVAGQAAGDDLIRLGVGPAAVRAQVVHGTFPSEVGEVVELESETGSGGNPERNTHAGTCAKDAPDYGKGLAAISAWNC